MEILKITVPIFLFVVGGYILSRKKVIGAETGDFISRLVYYLALPALIFRSIVSFDFASTFKLGLVVHNVTITVVTFALTFAAAFLISDYRKRGTFNMSCFRSNQGYMGLPLISGFFGQEAMSRAAIVNGFDLPVVVILSVFALEAFNKSAPRTPQSGSAGGQILRRMSGFLANPFVIASVAGLILAYFRIPILNIGIIDEFLSVAGGMALPLALISIGCSIKTVHLKSNIALVAWTTAVKLIAMPTLAFVLGYFVFGFRGVDLGIAVILPSTPTSVSSYVMAREMGADDELSASIIGVTTFVSVATISVIQMMLNLFPA